MYSYPGCRYACPGLCACWAFSPLCLNQKPQYFIYRTAIISILVCVCFEPDATGTSTALANVMRNGWLADGALSGNLVKKLCRDFARTSERKAHFCPISSAKPRFAFAVRHLSGCERPRFELRKTIFRASVRHVPRRETCLTVRWSMKCGVWNVELW